MPMIHRFGIFAAIVLLSLTSGAAIGDRGAPRGPVGAAFTYQGQLASAGSPVNASCDFQFSLWDDAAAGAQMGATLAPTLAVVHGLFTASLDFGNQFTGDERWLEIAVQCPGDPGFTLLSPRVALLGVPYANGLRPGIAVADSASGSSASIAIPGYGLAGSNSAGAGVHGSSASGVGVYGSSTAGPGVNGLSASDTGVLGEAQASLEAGVKGINAAASGIGVRGEANATGGVGVWGQSDANTGVYGLSTSGSGVWGQSSSGDAIYGVSSSGAGVLAASTSYFGVSGSTSSATLAGVRGVNLSTGVNGVGVSGSSTNGPGVTGTSASGNGMKGTSTDGAGVFGISTNGSGLYGSSAASNGVYGQSSASLQPGVRGVNNASSGIGVRGEANATGAVGVWGQSTANTGVYGLSTSGIGVWGQSTNGPAMRADGNAVQARDKGGWAKAMAYIAQNGTITRCYNGQTGSSSGGCGFSVSQPLTGVYFVDFGFRVDDRFVYVTPGVDSTSSNIGVIFDFQSANVTGVRTFYSDTRNSATNAPFMIIIF